MRKMIRRDELDHIIEDKEHLTKYFNENYLPEKNIPSTQAKATSRSANKVELQVMKNKELYK